MSYRRQKELARKRRNNKLRRRRTKRRQLLDQNSDYGFESKEAFMNWVEERAIKEGDLRTPCSCPMCGNPRKHCLTKTKAEILFDLKFREELEDVTD